MKSPHRSLRFFQDLALVVTILCNASVAVADDDLLDPTKLTPNKQTPESTELLDPTVPSKPGSTATRNTKAYESDGISAGDARAMAERVVSSLSGLLNKAGNLIETIQSLENEISDLEKKKSAKIKEKNLLMEEFRAGLFCSGCRETKSQILAKGEQFPHAGQSIVKPTPEQIAEEDRKLQKPIDEIIKKIREASEKHDKLKEELRETVQQIEYGMKLWGTAVYFEGHLNGRVQQEEETALKVEYALSEDQIRKLSTEIKKLDESYQTTAEMRRTELTKLKSELEKLGRSFESDKLTNENEIAQLRQAISDPSNESDIKSKEGRLQELLTRLSDEAKAHKEAKAEILKRISLLEQGNSKAAYEAARNILTKDLSFWLTKQNALKVTYQNTVQIHRQRHANANAATHSGRQSIAKALTDSKILTEHPYLLGFINENFALFATVNGSGRDLGSLYRMGDSSVSRRNETLPNVVKFVNAYHNCRWYRSPHISGRQSTPPPPDETNRSRPSKGSSSDLLEPPAQR